MGCIEHKFQIVLAGNLRQRLNRTGPPPQMDADNPGCAWCNHFLDADWVYGMGALFYIAKNGSYFLPLKGMSSGNKREGRNNNLAFKTQCTNRDFKSNGGIAHDDAVLDTEYPGKLLFEFLDVGAIVREPATVKDVT